MEKIICKKKAVKIGMRERMSSIQNNVSQTTHSAWEKVCKIFWDLVLACLKGWKCNIAPIVPALKNQFLPREDETRFYDRSIGKETNRCTQSKNNSTYFSF